MKNKTTTKKKALIIMGYIFVTLLIIGIVNAMYSGESKNITLSSEIVNCSVINSTYSLEGLNLSWNNKDIIVKTELGYHPDNLTISCWTIEQKEVITHSSSGGGYCIEKTNCTEWSECINYNQIQVCSVKNKLCKINTTRTERTCGNQSLDILNEITEAYMPTKKQSNLILWIIGGAFIFLLIGSIYWFLHKGDNYVPDNTIPIQVQEFKTEEQTQ